MYIIEELLICPKTLGYGFRQVSGAPRQTNEIVSPGQESVRDLTRRFHQQPGSELTDEPTTDLRTSQVLGFLPRSPFLVYPLEVDATSMEHTSTSGTLPQQAFLLKGFFTEATIDADQVLVIQGYTTALVWSWAGRETMLPTRTLRRSEERRGVLVVEH